MAVTLYARPQHQSKERSRVATTEDDRAVAARHDLGIFGEFVCGKVPATVHRSWFPYLCTGQSNESLNLIAGEDTSLLSFRGSAKTTWTRIFTAWAIGHNPHIQLGWISYNEATALKSSRVVKRIIESPRYRQVFPTIAPGSRWSDRDWEIDKKLAGISNLDSDFTFVALGITGAITSNRFHLGVFDDLIKSSAAIKNPEIRQQMTDNYGEVIEPCLAAVPGSRKISLGTRFRRDDILATEFIPEHDWRVIEQGVIVRDEDGIERSAWPERLDIRNLLKIRERRPVIFSYQWMNRIPDDDSDSIIKAEDIQYGDCPDKVAEIVITVDLAASEDDIGDPTAIIVGAKHEQVYYAYEGLELRVKGNLKKIKALMELRKKYSKHASQVRIIFEKGAYQNSFEGDWIDYKRQHRITNVLCQGLRVPGDKQEKLESVSAPFEERRVVFQKGHQWGTTVNQLLGLDTDHDDLRDAVILLISHLQRRSRKPIKVGSMG